MVRFDVKNKIILGFILMIVFLLIIIAQGWFTIEKNRYIDNVVITGYQIKIELLECRRQEKNILLRKVNTVHLALWQKAFAEATGIINTARHKGLISPEQSAVLNNELIKYKKVFDAFIQELNEKKNLTSEEIDAYDKNFIIYGRIINTTSDKISSDAEKLKLILDKQSKLYFLISCILGIIIFVSLANYNINTIYKSFKTIEKLNTTLEANYLELAIGLSEQFEILNRVAQGNLKIKAPENSKNELLAKLGIVINKTVRQISKLAKQEFEQTFVVTVSGLRIVDKDFNVTKVNKGLENFTGVSAEEMINKKCYEYLKGEYCHTDKCTLKQILSGAGHIQREMEREVHSGEKIFCLLNAIPLRNDEGKIIGIVEDFTDITKLKKTEKELEAHFMIFALGVSELFEALRRVSEGDLNVKVNEELEDELLSKLAQVINMAITNLKKSWEGLELANNKLKELQSQLVQTEKMAAIGQLAGGVAHEINNPLTGVLNNVQLIKMINAQGDVLEKKEFKELLDIIEESAQRCQKITKSLLDFSHASIGEFQHISLNKLIEKVTSFIGNELNLQNIRINMELQPDLPDILGDAQLLQQVIVNLFSNAKWAIKKKFKAAEGLITVKTEYSVKNGFVTVCVTDNGIGIDENRVPKIFEPFFTTKDVGEGTGLGLSVAYNIIKKHKGTISVESQVNIGTTFKLIIPGI